MLRSCADSTEMCEYPGEILRLTLRVSLYMVPPQDACPAGSLLAPGLAACAYLSLAAQAS